MRAEKIRTLWILFFFPSIPSAVCPVVVKYNFPNRHFFFFYVRRFNGVSTFFLLRFIKVVLESLYPGCPYEREVLGLEILQLVLAELLDSEGRGKRHAEESDLVKVISLCPLRSVSSDVSYPR